MANTYTTLQHKLTKAFQTCNQIFQHKEKHMATVYFEDLSVGQFAEYAKTCDLPIFALGGLSQADLAIAQQHYAYGIAGIRNF